MTDKQAPVLMCDKVEILGTKDGKERVIAVISIKDGKVVVESDDKAFKKDAENFINADGKVIRTTRINSSGFRQIVLIPQKPGEKYFLLSLMGPWGDKILDYTYVWGRQAGKIWEEEPTGDLL
ncbi:hypothetical protein KKE19_03580 [Patescibacteria group bacterium]|nr:hypothetical protein [Patescibacteria group bacterium]MBU4367964.1 hypothetical protein [Patescibacteria group bacterium]MBU4462145.1 hypothetical protein [Patescibacteria group bacterium]MCG2699807.1 hypothetical protein [Candidatus Parcubacteria bacterium]